VRAHAHRLDTWHHVAGAPKLLADLVEAVLGGVLLDSGGDLTQVYVCVEGGREGRREGGREGGREARKECGQRDTHW
jgi:hypothetical protein